LGLVLSLPIRAGEICYELLLVLFTKPHGMELVLEFA